MLKKLLAGVAVATAMLVSVSTANAATAWFTGGGTPNAGAYDFTGSDGTTIKAQAIAGHWLGGTLHQGSSGLYVTSFDCSNPFNTDCYNDNTHEIDGYKQGEGVSLTFGEEVYVEKVYFTYVGSNDDFAYRADGSGWTTEDIVGPYGNGYGNYEFSLPGLLGTVIDIAALGLNDDFKLKGVKYSVSAVPLPPAVLMFGAALMGLGWFRRRKAAA